jgi:hypothetical protein
MQIFPIFSVFILYELDCNANIGVLVQKSRIIRPFFVFSQPEGKYCRQTPKNIFFCDTDFRFLLLRKVKKKCTYAPPGTN